MLLILNTLPMQVLSYCSILFFQYTERFPDEETMSRILCLDSVSQVRPSFMNLITRSLRKFSGLATKAVLNPEKLQEHSPKNLLCVEPHVSIIVLLCQQ